MSTPGTRATDSDRNNTCQVLDAALEDGQLSMEEHHSRVSAATKPTILGELQSLTCDLQVHQAGAAGAPAPSGFLSRWGFRIAAAAVVLLVGLAVGWRLSAHTAAPPPSVDVGAMAGGFNPPAPVPHAEPSSAPTELHTADGLTNLLNQMRARFGDTSGYQLVIYPDYAGLWRPDPRNEHRAVSFDYRKGNWTAIPANMIPLDTAVADLGTFSVTGVVGAVREAPQNLKIGDVKATYVIVSGKPGGSLDLSIYVSDSANNSGHIDIAPDATVKAIYPPDY